MYTWRLKLRMWASSGMLNSALTCVIGETIWMLWSFRWDIMLSFGIVGETLEIMILLAGFINLLILIMVWPFNLMLGWLVISKSTVFFSLKNIQNRLLDMRETNLMFFGAVNLLMAMMYSIWGILSIDSKTIAWSFLGSEVLLVVSAKDFFPAEYLSVWLFKFGWDAEFTLGTLCMRLVELLELSLALFLSIDIIASLVSLSGYWKVDRGSLVVLSAGLTAGPPLIDRTLGLLDDVFDEWISLSLRLITLVDESPIFIWWVNNVKCSYENRNKLYKYSYYLYTSRKNHRMLRKLKIRDAIR